MANKEIIAREETEMGDSSLLKKLAFCDITRVLYFID